MKKLFIAIVAALMMLSCSYLDQSAMGKLERFADKMENQSKNWSNTEWDDKAQEYGDLFDEIDKHEGEYTEEEEDKILELTLKCSAMFMEHYAEVGFE